jgi:hypothetical protein
MQANYTTLTVTDDYKCSRCGAGNCKLWREAHTVAPKLSCANCITYETGLAYNYVDPDGQFVHDVGASDTLGWYVPAVPTEDTETYWGYSSWWRQLPNFPYQD